jgi:hypothetical protein
MCPTLCLTCLQLAARGAWEGPRPLLRRSVLLLSYWPLPDHWAILEANEYIWKTLAVLLIAAHACRPAQLYEADRRELVCLAEEPHDVPRDALVWSGDKRGGLLQGRVLKALSMAVSVNDHEALHCYLMSNTAAVLLRKHVFGIFDDIGLGSDGLIHV